jgi:hypothetical protein
VTVIVSSSGAYVSSFQVDGVYGTYTTGGACAFKAGGVYGSFPGGSINGNAFSFSLAQTLFQGAFTGVQSVSGTFRLYQPATSQSPACDTGTVSWSATTSATPPNKPPNSGPPGRRPTSRFRTSLVLHRLSRLRIGGQIRSSSAACRRDRVVFVWVGGKRTASVRSKASGAFRFALRKSKRSRHVHVSVAAKTISAGTCTAGASKQVKA